MALGSSFRTLTADNMEGVLGVKNYVKSSFETGVTDGWHKFNATLTSGLPTGAPTIDTAAALTTFTATSTTPLTGAYSLQVGTSSAAWGAGQGIISDVFTIDRMDGGKVITVSFDYEAIAGASNANWSGQLGSQSFAVYVYDVSASAWIQPAGFLGLNQSSGAGRVSATFQSSVVVGQQYRVAVICLQATIASQTITLNFDNFVCSRQIVPIGPVVTDWVSYTPSLTNFTIGNGSVEGRWRRVGDSGFYQISFLSGSTTSYSVGNLIFGLPSGHTIDSSKLPLPASTANSIGEATILRSGIARMTGAVVPFGTNGVVVFGPAGGTTANVAVGADVLDNNSPYTWSGAGDAFALEFMVPIVGWSSNVQMSSDTDTRVIASSMVQSSSTAITANVAIPFNATIIDQTGSLTLSTGRFTAPQSGVYQVILSAFARTAVGQTINLWKNSTTSYGLFSFGTSNAYYSGGYTLQLNAGEYIDVRCDANSTLLGGYTMSVNRLSGPSVLAATETVAARYTNISGQSFTNNTAAAVTGWVKSYDTNSAFNTSTGTYTVPVSGKYQINASFLWAGANVAPLTQYSIYIIQNGANQIELSSNFPTGSANTFVHLTGVSTIQCNAGDTIVIYAYQNSGGARTMANSGSFNYINFLRVGN